MIKYLILGGKGQLGKEFSLRFEKSGEKFISLDSKQLDISDLNSVVKSISEIKPEIIINTAAYNQVDLAEKDYHLAYKVNSLAINNLVFAAKQINSFIVHYGTDYVFDGEKTDGLYTEDDIPNPLSMYGKSKHMGELFLENYQNSLLLRLSWVFGDGNQNFIYKFMNWTKNNNILKISADEVSVPTSTKTIVDITLRALEKGITGKYHLANTGYCSRYEYAKYISEVKNLKNIIYPVSMDSFNLPAKRPRFSAMNNQRISNLLETDIPDWKSVVRDYLSSL